MRILIVSQYFWPENFRINDLATELIARGHEITVLTGVPNYPEGNVFADYVKNPAAYRTFNGAPIIRVPILSRGQGSLRLTLNYISFVLSGLSVGVWRLRNRQFDAIFVFVVSPITAVLPAILQRWLKQAPLFLWVLDLWPESLSAVGVIKSPRILAMVGRLVSFIYRRADHILVQSRSFISNVRRFAGNDARISYFPGWAEQVFDGLQPKPDAAPELAVYRDHFKVLFAGNVGEAQDFPAILEAAEALRDRTNIKIIVVGDGRASAWVAQEISRRKLSEQIVLLGRFPLERMPSFFSAADCLLVSLKASPIFSMTIPGKVQSYFAAAIPLIGMLDGEGADIILKAGAGLTCPAGRGDLLAQSIKRLSETPKPLRQAMGERARQYCEREFNRGDLVSKLEGWMQDCFDKRD